MLKLIHCFYLVSQVNNEFQTKETRFNHHALNSNIVNPRDSPGRLATMAGILHVSFKLLSSFWCQKGERAESLRHGRSKKTLQSSFYAVLYNKNAAFSYLSRLMQTSTKLERKRPNVRKKAIILHMASPPFHDTVMAHAISSGINRKVTCDLNGRVTFASMSNPPNQISCEKWRKRGVE